MTHALDFYNSNPSHGKTIFTRHYVRNIQGQLCYAGGEGPWVQVLYHKDAEGGLSYLGTRQYQSYSEAVADFYDTPRGFDEPKTTFWVNPWEGWNEEFTSWEEAISRAICYIKEDYENVRTENNYYLPEHLVSTRISSLG